MRASVVIAAFDAESTLGEQLEALSSQRVEGRWEVLVCDNGSRDGTVEVARSFAGRLPVRVIDASARRGPAAARNIGAQHAEGEALLFCDADDIVADGWVTAMLAALVHHDIVAGPWELSRLNAMYGPGATTPATFAVAPLIGLRAAGGGNLGVAAAVFAALDGFEEALRIGEDIDLCWRAQRAGSVLGEAPDAVVHVRRPASVHGLFRQAYAYGRGERQLTYRYLAAVLPPAADPLSNPRGAPGAPVTRRPLVQRIRQM
ncbi:MAG: glycosyltransferase, partial [Demequina sp.]